MAVGGMRVTQHKRPEGSSSAGKEEKEEPDPNAPGPVNVISGVAHDVTLPLPLSLAPILWEGTGFR